MPAINKIPMAVCLTDEHGFFEKVNDSYCRFFQFDEEDLLGKHFSVVLPKCPVAELTALHDRLIAEKEELSGEWNIKRKDGSLVDILTAATFVEVNGRPKKLTFVVNVTDIKKTDTDLRSTVAELNELMLQQETAFEILLHDLKSPIGNILSLSNFLNRSDFTLNEKQELIEKISSSAQKAFSLTRRLSNIVKLVNGNYESIKKDCNMIKIVKDAWHEVEVLANAKSLELKFGKNFDIQLSQDPFLLSLAISNLIKNAVEASPSGQKITVDMQKKADTLITIHNQGEIPADIKARFFNKYISSGKKQGSGLGSYIAKKAVEQMGGKLTFVSSSERGTTLYIRLPAAKLNVKKLAG